MTFLPIIQRELRVALRKRGTFWVKIVAPLVTLLIASVILASETLFSRSAQLGRVVFDAVTWLGIAAALGSGLFLTADCLSVEKREGTLGFLFLTDLRGYDIVLGKLMATSLRSFYALLAILPVLCLTLLTGGVTGLAFFKTTLALINALLCSLAAGLFVSSLSREAQKAMTGTLLTLLVICAGGMVADSALTQLLRRPMPVLFSLVSPWYVFHLSRSWGLTQFWEALLANLTLTCVLFALACFLVPRTWQEKARDRAGRRDQAYAWRYGGQKKRFELRQEVVGQNPVLWLACRERWQSLAVWIMVIIAACGLVLVYLLKQPEAWMAWNYITGLFVMALYLGVTSQACRFAIDAVRSGLIELLLISPLTEVQIVRGQVMALVRLFGWPVLVFVLLRLVPMAMGFADSGGARVMVTNGTQTVRMATTVATAIAGAVTTIPNLVALGWFSLWMGVTSKTTTSATLKAICFVQIIPMMVMNFSGVLVVLLIFMPQFMRIANGGPPNIGAYIPLIIAITSLVLSLIKDLAFINWSRRKLYSSFRAQATRSYDRPVFAVPPVIAIPPPAPPSIVTR